MAVNTTSEQALREMEQFLKDTSDEGQQNPFLLSAAVLISFEPENLVPFTRADDTPEMGWNDFFLYCDPVKRVATGNWWQLRPLVRQQALQQLGSREGFRQALAVNPDRAKEPLQLLYEQVLTGAPIDVERLQREELVSLSYMMEWLKYLPSPELAVLQQEVQKAIPMADLLVPLYKLAGTQFVGRRSQLNAMAEYVGILPQPTDFFSSTRRFFRNALNDLGDHPPLLIHGPGGIGKSTLIAKFILNNAGHRNDNLPFAYLDTDRTIIEPRRPQTYFIEAARQLMLQCPEQQEELLNIKEALTKSLQREDQFESAKGGYVGGAMALEFGRVISRIKTPVLIVIDTFEEVQFLGKEVVNGVWSLLMNAQSAAPNLRIIVGGRVIVENRPVQELPLKELDQEEAVELIGGELEKVIEPSEVKAIAGDIINVAGLNPMSLRLALTIVQEQGIHNLKKVSTRNWFMQRVRTEVVQARLYGRILNHIHNDEVRQLAFPGLVVRRITADIILQVLAGPCNLDITTPEEAADLLDLLADEGALVSRDLTDGALYHRQDVRRVMLKDLKEQVNTTVIKAIHKNAVNFYNTYSDPISRAEEIYHRLALGEEPAAIEKRWMPGIENRLRNALEELPQQGLLWLSAKLGVTLDENMLKTAGLEDWENITAVSAGYSLQTGNTQQALEAIRQRNDRSPNSPLYRLELEALRSLSLYQEAAFLVDEMLASFPQATEPSIRSEINLQAAFAKEALGLNEEAIRYVKQASVELPPEPNKDGIRTLVTHMRLLRKMGDRKDNERKLLVAQAIQWLANKELLASLREYPALFREIVAELGKVMPQLLENAIDWLGIELRNDQQVGTLSQALVDWNTQLQKEADTKVGELQLRAGLDDDLLPTWFNYIKKSNATRLTSNIQHWRKELYVNDIDRKGKGIVDFDKALVDIFRNNVDISINKDLLQGGSGYGFTTFK
ncbi:hypothetical protein [Niastella sp. OAS944]|uniref:hypothetical protein n=1 Tax=Niastella sp. OAS944 TaxID=2664089 RepID=UPI003494A3DF|nr:tetratricopeptide (TPR) repeat protein [Chitinophagaceae bacterium OAS944]